MKFPVRLSAVALLIASIPLALSSQSLAGTLTPPGPPGPTMVSLDTVHQAAVQAEEAASIASAPFSPRVAADTEAYARVESNVQGLISQDATTIQSVGFTRLGHEDEITVVNFSLNISVPVDSSSGSPTGSSKLNDLTITKNIDKTSPQLLQALATNDLLSIVLKIYRPRTESVGGGGPPENYYTITIDDGFISGYEQVAPKLEKLTFSARRIMVEHPIVSTSAVLDFHGTPAQTP